MKDSIFLILLMPIIPGICLIVIYVQGAITEYKEISIGKEIIKQSEEYTIFNECTEIQGKYYCK